MLERTNELNAKYQRTIENADIANKKVLLQITNLNVSVHASINFYTLFYLPNVNTNI